ncbi:hypothetical protein [Mycobacterium phage WXIN]|nr:hypothetical protein [Mycobacterium phage WXIN]
MSVNGTVAHRMSFPILRRITQQMLFTVAVLANAATTEYLQARTEEQPAPAEEEPLPGCYL